MRSILVLIYKAIVETTIYIDAFKGNNCERSFR